MKTFTTLAAAAMLIAGMSVANAAGTSTINKSTNMNSSMSKSAQIMGTKKYCMKTKAGTLNCKFASLQACKKGSKSATCVVNPHTSTTGSGMHKSSSMKKSK